MNDRRQRNLRRVKGLCWFCAVVPFGGSSMCERHLKKHRERRRRQTASDPWRHGGRGRPPVETRLQVS